MLRTKPRRIISAALLGVILALASCEVSPDRFKPKPPNYGFKEMGQGEYSIVLFGGPRTTLGEVAANARLRAARMTRAKGFTHFAVIHDKRTYRKKVAGTSIPVAGPPFMIPIGEVKFVRPTVTLIVKVMRQEEGTASGALNAADVERKAALKK